jgi:leader peptidase (prepilin peptidase)/N-methyltransferase
VFPDWTVVVGFMLGATIGSFLNVVIYRLPRGMSLSNPSSSFCPICKHWLHPVDLVPLFSWLSTGGKCRYCLAPIPPRYFFVELLTGALWAGLWWQYLVLDDQWVTACFFAAAAAALVAVIYIDWELYIIPDELNAAILFIGIGLQGVLGTWTTALVGALLGWGLLWGIALLGRLGFGKDAMGHGDIKMMRGVGAIIGPLLLVANLGIAVILGLVVGILMIMLARKAQAAAEAEGTDEEPYQPEPIRDLLLLGVYYLLCLDVLALAFRGIERTVSTWLIQKPAPESIEDDDWKPSLTTIPFGPYLAAGAIVCMLFGGAIETGMRDYWRNATGETETSSLTR